jgi:hypothetical protein
MLAVFYWGGAQVTWLRIVLSMVADILLVAYLLWAARILKR